jgi:glyoxalase family protein
MDLKIPGIHHITAIASDPQRNLDFYTQVLGLRLVKLTVNFDAPDTYHFYFGDGAGHPGSILTFFPWPDAHRGLHGTRQATMIAFSIPAGSTGFWVDRLKQQGMSPSTPIDRFGEEVVPFVDPDGLQLELVAVDSPPATSSWEEGPVPPEHALGGFHGVTLLEEGFEATSALLKETFGFQLTHEAENRARFEALSDQYGRHIDLISLPDAPLGRLGAGIVHHVAWRAADEAQQLAWRERLIELEYDVTPVLDRQYFHSIYFREPGGVLFEIATDPPGFATDEQTDCLGSSLKLPPWLEPQRAELMRTLPTLHMPSPCPQLALSGD